MFADAVDIAKAIIKSGKAIIEVSFSTREIVYESNCGDRRLMRVTRPFGNPFPIEPKWLLSREEIQDILNHKADRGKLEQAMIDLGIA